jgi:hypothetical protein
MASFYALIAHDSRGIERDNFYLQTQRPSLELSIGWGKVNPIGSIPEKIREDIEKHYPGAGQVNNAWNGQVSLPLFASLIPGDFVFVRGTSCVLDVVIISAMPYYSYGHGHDGPHEYCTKVKFVPISSTTPQKIATTTIPGDIREDFLYAEGGTHVVMKKLQELAGQKLLSTILNEYY